MKQQLKKAEIQTNKERREDIIVRNEIETWRTRKGERRRRIM
jgi:hypothetical protein